jgi:hypothetical protein
VQVTGEAILVPILIGQELRVGQYSGEQELAAGELLLVGQVHLLETHFGPPD